MFNSQLVKAINSNIEPVTLTRQEVLDTRIKNFELVDLNVLIAMQDIEIEAIKLQPIFQAEIIVREIKLNKKVQMWSNEEYKEFENYFASKYIDNKIAKGVS